MNNITKLQIDAAEQLTKSVARIDHAIKELSTITNPFDIEARVYFIKMLAAQTNALANRLHGEMHEANSVGTEHYFAVRP